MDVFKCGMMGGVRKSNKTDTTIVVVDWQGDHYRDRWDHSDLIFQGRGFRSGAMGRYPNSALIEAAERNKPIHLFERYRKGSYTYRGLAVVYGVTAEAGKRFSDGGDEVPWFTFRPIRTDRDLENFKPIAELEISFFDSPEHWQQFALKRAQELGIVSFDVPSSSASSWPMVWESLWREYADNLLTTFLDEVEKYGHEVGLELIAPYYEDLVRGSVWAKVQIVAAIAASAITITAKYPEAKENFPILKKDAIEAVEKAKIATQKKIGQILLEVHRQPSPGTPLAPKIGPAISRRKNQLEGRIGQGD